MRSTDNPFPFFQGKLLLYQPEKHKVSVDLVLFLSKLRGIKRSSKVVDLGAGFGFISLVLAKKFGVKVTAVEIDDTMLSLLQKNIKLNNLSHLIEIVKADVREIHKHFKRGSFDVVVANPPFYPKEHSPNPDPYHFEVRGA
ncbi:methyltransferase, partial [Aquifex sp.]